MLNNIELGKFLKHFESNATVEILEEGKQKNELMDIAKKRGILAKGSTDLGILKTIYAYVDTVNENSAILPKKEMLEILPQMIGKPINRNHLRDQIRGVIIDYEFVNSKNMIIAYASFFKSIFEDEWKEALKLQKQGRLASSFEIYAPKAKRKYNQDGSFKMFDMEIAGMGLLFDSKEDPMPPAFPNAKTLALAKQAQACLGNKYLDLVYASKYKESDIITAEETMVKCKNCSHEFNYLTVPEVKPGSVKCPKCSAIVNQKGEVLLVPQVINFKIACLKCGMSNWQIAEENEDSAKVSCLDCGKKYKLVFQKETAKLFDFPLGRTLDILPHKTFVCPQCGKIADIGSVKTVKESEVLVKCKQCDLVFPKSLNSKKMKKIKEISEIIEQSSSKNLPEGGKKMKGEIELSKYHRYGNIEDIEEATKSKDLPDSSFAVVVRVKDKGTGKRGKIRKYSISDSAQIKAVLAEIDKAEVQATLKKLGVSIESVKRKILKRAKQLKKEELASFNCECIKCGYKMTSDAVHCKDIDCAKCGGQMRRVERPGAGQPKKAKVKVPVIDESKKSLEKELENSKTQITTLEEKLTSTKKDYEDKLSKKDKEIAGLQKDFEKKIKFYKENAITIEARRTELANFAKDLSDEDLLNEDKYTTAKLQQQLVIKKDKETKSKKSVETSDKKDKRSYAQKATDRVAYQYE